MEHGARRLAVSESVGGLRWQVILPLLRWQVILPLVIASLLDRC
jgi:hypothetical protein